MNVGFMVMNNLQLPNDDEAEEKVQPQSRGLLLRKPKTNAPKNIMDMEPRERIARYVGDIRKARMGLRNGRG
jgi:hypothetical protein